MKQHIYLALLVLTNVSPILSNRMKRSNNPFMTWSHFEPGVTNRLYMKWKDSCPGCTGSGLEVTFQLLNGTRINDHVCLEKTADCVYKGYFSHETSTEVVVTKDCPMQSSDTMEVSFKCHLIEGFNFISRWADGATAHSLSADSGNRRDLVVAPQFRRSSNETLSRFSKVSRNLFK